MDKDKMDFLVKEFGLRELTPENVDKVLSLTTKRADKERKHLDQCLDKVVESHPQEAKEFYEDYYKWWSVVFDIKEVMSNSPDEVIGG